MKFETKVIPNLADFGRDGKISPAGMLRIFEDLGSAHSESVGDGVRSARERGTAWVLTDWRVSGELSVDTAEELKAVTWSEKSASSIATHRHYAVYNQAGELCFRGTSKWVLFDIASQKIVRIPQELIALYDGESGSIYDDNGGKRLREPKEYEAEKEVALRRSDIDFNLHVHNLRSLDFAMEAIPQDVYDKADFAEIRITYKQQIKEGDELVCKYAHEDKLHYVGIYGKDGVLRSLAEFTER